MKANTNTTKGAATKQAAKKATRPTVDEAIAQRIAKGKKAPAEKKDKADKPKFVEVSILAVLAETDVNADAGHGTYARHMKVNGEDRFDVRKYLWNDNWDGYTKQGVMLTRKQAALLAESLAKFLAAVPEDKAEKKAPAKRPTKKASNAA